MNIVGALSKTQSNDVVYFCKYEEGDIETEKLLELYDKNGYTFPENGKVRIVVIESTDYMENDKRVIGVMVETPTEIKGVLLDGQEELDYFLKELI